jgi:hypothetical protein
MQMICNRMVYFFGFMAIMFATSAHSAERPLKGPEIDALIKGNTVTGENINGIWKQFFDASGETTYLAPEKAPTVGTWNVQGDRFCSKWPPNDNFVCYDVTGDLDAKPKSITWISGGGTKYPGTVQAGKAITP